MANEKEFHVGIKALIENKQGKVLLMKTVAFENSKAHWDIPGGRIQSEDTIGETLRREVEEETGITKVLSENFFTAVVSNIEIPLPDGKKVGLVLMVYRVEVPDNSDIRLSEEHVAYEWVGKSEASVRLAHKYPRELTNLLRTHIV